MPPERAADAVGLPTPMQGTPYSVVADSTSTVLASLLMARSKSKLTTFILSVPETLTPVQVAEKAKARGMATSERNVGRVRSEEKKRSAAAAKTAPALAAKTASPAPKAAGRAAKTVATKADFVRTMPRSMPAKEVVATAKAAGVQITEKYVYNVRSDSKPGKAAAKKPAAAAKAVAKPSTPVKAAAVSTGTVSNGGNETQLRKLVLALGVVRSRQLLDELERGLAGLIRG